MSSSFKQKKLKTLATRKKTRKRKMQLGMTHEDESGRLFQPPSRRDPRWKKPTAEDLVGDFVRAKKKQKVALLSGSEDDEDDEEEEFPEVAVEESEASADEEEASSDQLNLPKPVLRLCKTMEECVKRAVTAHKEIRREDGRQKAKVLVLADTRSVFKALKLGLGVKAEPVKSKSKFGVRSEKKTVMAYRHIGPLKTPMDKFKDANKDVLNDFKVGKVPTLLAEDLSYYPYSNLALQHLVLVAKSAQSAINLDRAILADLNVQVFVVEDANSAQHAVARSHLEQAFTLVE
ncbi:hypothetical protein Poli38472_005242 [Pythium oligandrum]|uniref:Uncharacterized protein n=1 Tax=Pythium oligandrum TaxID=41045 RepID=A0A8K1FJ08_PYTOL|nr:hypothetical protein Poli38472_005242 [Pythium oligandrum]|eukprot:TMW62624.1 hypothetical protein Poli38472_005242 [Pythium oligandrum]